MIQVDCQVNASASLRRGFLSFFGHDLVLNIGLPIAAGLSLKLLTGVLAHEFGHFSQGMAMRLSYIIESVNHWFARVVYERDRLDQELEHRRNETESLALRITLWLSTLAVSFGRGILWVLMTVGRFMSSHLLWQMEFDADLHTTRLVGSREVEGMLREVSMLGSAADEVGRHLGEMSELSHLVTNYPLVISESRARVSDHLASRIWKSLLAD